MGLDGAAVAAVWKWKFAPGTLYGTPVPMIYNVAIHFRLPPPE
jgi:hypothetical protein